MASAPIGKPVLIGGDSTSVFDLWQYAQTQPQPQPQPEPEPEPEPTGAETQHRGGEEPLADAEPEGAVQLDISGWAQPAGAGCVGSTAAADDPSAV
jgi:hypothetical protein